MPKSDITLAARQGLAAAINEAANHPSLNHTDVIDILMACLVARAKNAGVSEGTVASLLCQEWKQVPESKDTPRDPRDRGNICPLYQQPCMVVGSSMEDGVREGKRQSAITIEQRDQYIAVLQSKNEHLKSILQALVTAINEQ